MKKYISYIFSVCLIIGLTFLVTEKGVSQSNQKTVSGGTSTYVTGITTGRARALVGVGLGLISLVIGWRAKARSAGNSNRRTGAIVALVLGLISIILSIVHLSTSVGAVFGSGSGKAGAIVGLVLGFIGMAFGRLALRQRKYEKI
jgi:hypothetical protein